MGTENVNTRITYVAGEDQNATGFQYHAVDVAGILANTGRTCVGIILGKPKTGDFAPMCVGGMTKIAAGAAIAAGALAMATTSGWFITVTSGSVANARALAAITSGSVGAAIFAPVPFQVGSI